MNPDYKPSYGYDNWVNEYFIKKEKLKRSQMYKRSNQSHPAFKKKK